MPARYRPGSEYKKKFRWHDSVKSASFTPTTEQKAPKAGLGSGEIAFVQNDIREPPLQRKHKPLAQQRTHTINQLNQVSSDTDSMSKSRTTIAPAKTYKIHQYPAASKSLSSDRKKHSNGVAKSQVTASQPRVPHMGITQEMPMQRKERHGSGGRAPDTNKNNNKTVNVKAKTSAKVSDAAVKNGSSGDKVETSRALQYQAGIHPNRPKSAKYLSEYQRQFEWKKPLPKESPLIAAEQMVYSSNTNIAPFIPDRIPRNTEYQKQFQAWQPLQPPPQEQLMENAQREIKAKYRVKTKSKKSKKTTPDRMRTAGMPSFISHENLQQLKLSQNPQQPFFPHSNARKWRSEYNSNFKSPAKFRYEDGVWKGAGPPHIQPKDDSNSDLGKHQRAAPLRRTKSQHDLPNWFAEVQELRKKAQEYQQRARGTHFSREHVAQLIAQQAQMWDASSTTASSTTSSLSAPSVETDKQERARNKQPTTELVSSTKPQQDNNNNMSPVRRKLAWPDDKPRNKTNDRPGNESSSLINGGEQESSIGSIPTPEGYRSSVSASSDDFEVIESNGRPPTPQLKETGIKHRHHLDKTTPAVGGAILTSPLPVRKTPPRRTAPGRTRMAKAGVSRHQVEDRCPAILPGGTDKEFDWFTSDEDEDHPTPQAHTPPPHLSQQTRLLQKAQASPPTAGKPTRDTHPLNDQLRSPTFKRHSEHFFESNPEFQKGINPTLLAAQTWAAPRDTRYISSSESNEERASESYSGDEDVQRRKDNEQMLQIRTMPAVRKEESIEEVIRPRPATMHAARQGPLDRPNSESMHGRPMTAYPQSRQAVADKENSDNPNSTNHITSDNPTRPENRHLRAARTWTVPRETNVNIHNRDGDVLLTPRGSVSNRLSMSGISSVSSSSLASEVLERARKRRDEFWGTP